MAQTMHIVLSADNTYAKYMAVTIVSVLCNKAEEDVLFFHVLDGGIQPENREKILEAVARRGSEVEFVPVDPSLLSGRALHITEKNHVTPATYYRLLIPSLIHAERCIYLDCDMICRASLGPLWNTDLGGKIAAAVKDIDEDRHSVRLGLKRYFNAGMLVLDLSMMRKLNTQKRFFEFLQEHHEKIVQHDQDILNCVLHDRIHELDMTWNCQVAKTRKCKEAGFHNLSRSAKVLHFIGHRKPWLRGCRAPERANYWMYLQKTPWKESFFHRIWRILGRLSDASENSIEDTDNCRYFNEVLGGSRQ